jgi:outer membrane protein TolC
MSCASILTVHDVARCIGSTRVTLPIPKIDGDHAYTLPELIDLAETANPEGRIAWAEAKEAMERAGVDRAQYLPLLTMVAETDDARVLSPFPKPLAPRGYVTVEQPTVAAQLELEYRLLDFGRAARLEGSKALELASALSLGRVHQKIAFDVASQFYATQRAIGELDAAKAILQTAETVEGSAQSQYDNGRATLPDLENARAGTAAARYQLAAAEGETHKAFITLTKLIGVEPTSEMKVVSQSRDGTREIESSIDDLIETALKSRPDLQARAQELRNAQQEYRVAHSAYFPRVDMQAAGGQTAIWPAADFGQLGQATVPTWSFSVGLHWQVFNAARSHEINTAMAEEKAAAEQERATRDAVSAEVWNAYVDYHTALEQEKASQSFLAAATTSYDSSLDAFRYGVRSLVDVVEAERQLAQARLEAVRALAYRLQAETALVYSTGTLLRKSELP